MNSPVLYLASASPRRRELLRLLGIPFAVESAEVDEHTSLGALDAVSELCRRKAAFCASRHPGSVILAADTLVALHDRPFGKPSDPEEAVSMLLELQGKCHQVHTGVCAVDPQGHFHQGVDSSHVTFYPMSEAEIRAYVRTGEPMDKAGAYALQGIGGMFVKSVSGTPSGIIGLPLPLTRTLLGMCGISILNS